MGAKLFTFKIVYQGCNNKIWRKACVSSNYPLINVGYMVLATFDSMSYHYFEMEYKGVQYCLDVNPYFCFEEKPGNEKASQYKVGQLGMKVGDVIKMTYDFGYNHIFTLKLLEISDMPKGHGRAYPKIIDGAGRGIIDDIPPFEMSLIIKKTDKTGHSDVYYSKYGFDSPEWNYKDYDIKNDNSLLKGEIDDIRRAYECEVEKEKEEEYYNFDD